MQRREDLFERLDAVETRAQRREVRLCVDPGARLGDPCGVERHEDPLAPGFDESLIQSGGRSGESVGAMQGEELGHVGCPAWRRV